MSYVGRQRRGGMGDVYFQSLRGDRTRVRGRASSLGFVADDHAFTRGAGAIAAFDARRRSALGRVDVRGQDGGGGGSGPTPPPAPPRPTSPSRPPVRRPPSAVAASIRLPGLPTNPVKPGAITPTTVKYPGMGGGFGTSTMSPANMPLPPGTAIGPPAVGVRPPTVQVGVTGGGGSSVSSGIPVGPVLEPIPEAAEDVVDTAPEPAPASSSKGLLIAAAAGLGLFLLLRRQNGT